MGPQRPEVPRGGDCHAKPSADWLSGEQSDAATSMHNEPPSSLYLRIVSELTGLELRICKPDPQATHTFRTEVLLLQEQCAPPYACLLRRVPLPHKTHFSWVLVGPVEDSLTYRHPRLAPDYVCNAWRSSTTACQIT